MSSKNLEFSSDTVLCQLLLGIGVSHSSFIGDAVVLFLQRKWHSPFWLPIFFRKLNAWNPSLSLSLSVQGYGLEGSNIGNDGEEVCPSITTFSDLLEAEKWVWWLEGPYDQVSACSEPSFSQSHWVGVSLLLLCPFTREGTYKSCLHSASNHPLNR